MHYNYFSSDFLKIKEQRKTKWSILGNGGIIFRNQTLWIIPAMFSIWFNNLMTLQHMPRNRKQRRTFIHEKKIQLSSRVRCSSFSTTIKSNAHKKKNLPWLSAVSWARENMWTLLPKRQWCKVMVVNRETRL